jgi:hypothetical protein
MPKGRKYEPKAKGPHHHQFQKLRVSKNIIYWYPIVFKRGRKQYFKNVISKPSWTLRGALHLGGVLFKSKEKHLKQGKKISNLENALQILFIYLWLFAKDLWKRIYKRVCKNKTCGASVVQNIKNERNNPCISCKYSYWPNSKQPLHLHYTN